MSMSISSTKVRNIDSIQIMRGVAASGVVVHHSLHAIVDSRCDSNYVCTAAINFGASGVDIFFIISGFIMLYTSKEEFGSAASALDFLIRRAIRIVPLYWVLSSILVAGALSGVLLKNDTPTVHNILYSYFFLPNITPHGAHQLHIQFWIRAGLCLMNGISISYFPLGWCSGASSRLRNLVGLCSVLLESYLASYYRTNR